MENSPKEGKKNGLDIVEGWLSKIEIIIAWAMAVMSMIIMFWIVAGITGRFVFLNPLKNTEFIALLMIPLGYLPLSFGLKHDVHVRVDFFINMLKGRVLYHRINAVLPLLGIFGLAIVTVTSFQYTHELFVSGEIEMNAYETELWYFYGAGSLGFALLTIRLMIQFIENLTLWNSTKGSEK